MVAVEVGGTLLELVKSSTVFRARWEPKRR
jgi:hypothetical protein